MTFYTDRLEAAVAHGLPPAQARLLAGSGRRMAEALAEWREEGADAEQDEIAARQIEREARKAVLGFMTALPNHPDQSPRMTQEQVREAIDNGKYIGSCSGEKDCSWEFLQWGDRYFCFLNDIGVSEWGWEVSASCAKSYIDQPA